MRSVGRIHQLNVSAGGVPKLPIAEGRVTSGGIEGDAQANRRIHGGPTRALCLYALEWIETFQREGHPVQPGSAGENVTVAGVDWRLMRPGGRVRLGESVVIEITDYAAPCMQNARWFADGDVQRMSQHLNPGASRVYARVLDGGVLRVGDAVEVLDPEAPRPRIPTVRWKPPS